MAHGPDTGANRLGGGAVVLVAGMEDVRVDAPAPGLVPPGADRPRTHRASPLSSRLLPGGKRGTFGATVRTSTGIPADLRGPGRRPAGPRPGGPRRDDRDRRGGVHGGSPPGARGAGGGPGRGRRAGGHRPGHDRPGGGGAPRDRPLHERLDLPPLHPGAGGVRRGRGSWPPGPPTRRPCCRGRGGAARGGRLAADPGRRLGGAGERPRAGQRRPGGAAPGRRARRVGAGAGGGDARRRARGASRPRALLGVTGGTVAAPPDQRRR